MTSKFFASSNGDFSSTDCDLFLVQLEYLIIEVLLAGEKQKQKEIGAVNESLGKDDIRNFWCGWSSEQQGLSCFQ